MSTITEKLDSGLAAAYRAWSQHPQLSPHAGISVILTHEGDLAAIEALGFETHSPSADRVLGVVHFKDIPRLTASPQVLYLAAGIRRRKYLDTAVRDIKARATSPVTGTPVDGVWHADIKTGALTAAPKATGKGVIVAIIDTGIDFTHPMFMSQLTPTKKTRILKIWDQSLVPTAFAQCPDKTLLESSKTYGVEFSSAQIETHLNGGAKIATKDCDGHGTHVAGIAAGGNIFPASGDAHLMGVAPEADILFVKFNDGPEHIFYVKPDGSQDTEEVGGIAQFHDAVLYCLRTAKRLSKPVVVNMSFGDDGLPGDGLDDDARWADKLMDPAHAASDNNFPKGAILVKAAGNEGRVSRRRVARIKVTHLAEVRLPLMLEDNRNHNDTDWQNCKQRLYTPDIHAYIWYRTQTAQPVKVAMRSPAGTSYSIDVAPGGTFARGIKPPTGSATEDTFEVPVPLKNFSMKVEHNSIPAVPHPAGGTVSRSLIKFSISPKVSAGTVSYYTGLYQLRITAPQDLEIFVLTDDTFWNDEDVRLFVNPKEVGGSALDPSEINVTEKFSMTDPMGKNVLTIAAYTDKDGNSLDPAFRSIAEFSSRGPMRNYSDPAAPKSVFNKPDIAAPGEKIESALTRDGQTTSVVPWWDEGVRFQELGGTSMATPMVVGVVALLLEKKPTLNVTDVRTHLTAAARAAVNPAIQPDATQAYGAGMVDAMAAHKHVT
jgi:subtilisin family serine protease